MHKSSATLVSVALGVTLLAGCSSDGGLLGTSLTTQSIGTNPSGTAVAAAPKVDPACYSLQQKIDTLRKDGLTERLEKAASGGKSTNVSVKRTSLAQAAELDKANAEFQAKCSAFGPRPVQAAAQVTPVANSAQVVSATAPKTQPAIAPPVVQQRQ
ncbi:hypothetical protein [Hyphomicrobium sp.]|uniref:hypothetical protein n=1 Tax=Hyphomicrobium sp. TaxID=82 RepID=UPI002E363FF5|nr:hypothetical protein [Hyphomicrobium sp.]HEX2842992.1 hypothetical protein [Hyphomicrobium sp.]